MFVFFTGPNKPYTPLIPAKFFTPDTIKKLRDSEKVNGMMVMMTDETDAANYPVSFSSDQHCPNLASSIYEDSNSYSCDNHKFNPEGSGLNLENIDIPVMLLRSQSEVDEVMTCYQTHNKPGAGEEDPEYPLCSVELKAFMHGAGSTEICWRRNTMVRNFAPDSYCQQLGGRSSFAFLNYNSQKLTRNKTIVVTTRIDSFSLFEYSEPGASSPVPGITVMLAVAEAMRPLREHILASGYNIMFLALTGEAWDYIGSQRVVYDMETDAFPEDTSQEPNFHLSQVHLVVELSQLISALNGNKDIFAHTDPNTASKHPQIINFIKTLQAEQVTVTVENATTGQPLPPASSQMFIRSDEDNGVAAVVLADFNEKFKTKFYNSYLDTATAQGFNYNRNKSAIDPEAVIPQGELLADIATSLVRALYKYTTNNSTTTAASPVTASKLLYCFLKSPQCDIFLTVVAPKNAGILNKTGLPFPFFVSVYMSSSVDNLQSLVYRMLAYYTGDAVQIAEENCTGQTLWMSGMVVNGTRSAMCIESSAQYHKSYSPAFDIEDYNFTSTLYSTWSESVWPNTDAFHVRLFLQPSAEVELASMIAGISAFILTAVLAVLVQRRAAILFPPHDDHVLLNTQSGNVDNPAT